MKQNRSYCILIYIIILLHPRCSLYSPEARQSEEG